MEDTKDLLQAVDWILKALRSEDKDEIKLCLDQSEFFSRKYKHKLKAKEEARERAANSS